MRQSCLVNVLGSDLDADEIYELVKQTVGVGPEAAAGARRERGVGERVVRERGGARAGVW